MAALPVILVLINYPIDGLMLLISFSYLSRVGIAPRVGSVRRFRLALYLSTLLFANIGATIDFLMAFLVFDWAVEGLYWVLVLSLALIAIGVSAIWVGIRYLGLSIWPAIIVGFIAILVNFLAWGLLTTVDEAFFLLFCIPWTVAFYLLFVYYLHRTTYRLSTIPSPLETVPGPELAMARRAVDRPVEAVATTDLGPRRWRELEAAVFLSLGIVVGLTFILPALL